MAKRRTHKKKDVFRFKITKELVIFLSCLVVLIAAAIVLSIPRDNENIYDDYSAAATSLSTSDNTVNSLTSKEHVFKTISYKDLVKKIDKEDGLFYVYYSSTTVSDAVSIIATVNTIAESYDVSTVYLLDNSFYTDLDLTDGDDNTTLDTYEAALGLGASTVNTVDLSVTPSLFAYEGHKLVFNSNSKDFVTDDNQPKYTWNVVLNQAFYLNKTEK